MHDAAVVVVFQVLIMFRGSCELAGRLKGFRQRPAAKAAEPARWAAAASAETAWRLRSDLH
jgi:hypothetical protein